jgi:hypothetical protein
MRIFLLFWGTIYSLMAFAQQHDNIWVMGFEGGGQTPITDSFGITILDFSNINKTPLIIENQYIATNMDITNAVISDSLGVLQFYSNGEHIYHRQHQIMQGGANIAEEVSGYGSRLLQGGLALPWPGREQEYLLLTVEYDPVNIAGQKLFYHQIDMSLAGGLGKVVDKRHLLIEDTLTGGQLAAVKHANGRDWWFVVMENRSSGYYTGLVRPDTILVTKHDNGAEIPRGLQSGFSPDGRLYYKVNLDNIFGLTTVDIFDFDRCTGLLSNQRSKTLYPTDHFLVGGCISLDSRYLYVFDDRIAYQYDLMAADIWATEQVVAEWDGSMHYIWPRNFFMGMLAPDGRIYIKSNNSNSSLHRIHLPNRSAMECAFVQNDIIAPTKIRPGLPNFPNFRLGPLDGSACDTLGLDNHPLARFRWEREPPNDSLGITFTDLSTYEPTTWQWDFGDGSSSMEASPHHEYASEGTYQVCLVVSNQYSADTFCQVLHLGLSAVTEADAAITCALVPNPADQSIQVVLQGNWGDSARFSLFDLQGRLVLESAIVANMQRIETRALVTGTYLYRLNSKGAVLSGKLLIQH